MRIGYVVADSGIPVFGNKGASVHVREFIRALGLNHTVDLYCAALGSDAHDLPVRALYHQDRTDLDPSGDKALDRDRRRLATVDAVAARLDAVHSADPYDLVYERYSLFSTVGLSLSQRFGLPYLLEVNAPLIEERQRVEPLPLAPLARERETAVFRGASAVLCVSEAMAQYVLAQGAKPDRVHVVPNAVDVSRFHPAISGEDIRRKYGLQHSHIVGFTGSLKPWHGVDLLLRAFQRASEHDWHLLIVGDGPERNRLQSLASELGILSRTTFTGAVHHDSIPAHVAAFDVAVAPYRGATDFYFSPLKLYEYLAAGRAVIAADIGQISSIVRHWESGYLFPPDDIEALVDGLRQLAVDARLRQSLQNEAPRGLPSWEHVTKRVLEIAEASRRAA
jgi:glycosyltransferase involved in cell wall biosynthesis